MYPVVALQEAFAERPLDEVVTLRVGGECEKEKRKPARHDGC